METIAILFLSVALLSGCGIPDNIHGMDVEVIDMDKKLDQTNQYMKNMYEVMQTGIDLARQFMGLDPTPKGEMDISTMSVNELQNLKDEILHIQELEQISGVRADAQNNILSGFTVKDPPPNISNDKRNLILEIQALVKKLH